MATEQQLLDALEQSIANTDRGNSDLLLVMKEGNLSDVTLRDNTVVPSLSKRVKENTDVFKGEFETSVNQQTQAQLDAFNADATTSLQNLQTAIDSINNEGNAASATKLQTARLINGEIFDGTANINIAAGMLTGGNVWSGTQTVNGDLTVSDNFTVNGGQAVVGDLTVSGGFTVNGGQAVVGDLSVSGNFTVNGVGVFGVGQNWQDVKASRSISTNYTNTSGKLIKVSVSVQSGSAGTITLVGRVSGVDIDVNTIQVGGGGFFLTCSIEVPNGKSYAFLHYGDATLLAWNELS